MKQQTTVPNEIKPLNYKQLAATYDVSPRTIKSWLRPFIDEIGEMRGKVLTVKQILLIYDKIGKPKGVD